MPPRPVIPRILCRSVTTYKSPIFPSLSAEGQSRITRSYGNKGFATFTRPTKDNNEVEILSVGKVSPSTPATVPDHSSILNDALALQWRQLVNRFDGVWLRDSCTCEHCVDPHSGQKNFQTAHIPKDIRIAEATQSDDGSVAIKWGNDIAGFTPHHTTVLNPSRILDIPGRDAHNFCQVSKPWQGIEHELSGLIPYEGFVNDPKVLKDALTQLHEYGLIILHCVPESESSVIKLAEQMGPLRSTFYGSTWDVKDKVNAKNVAYTSKHLGMHMDLLYMKDPPGIQLLHCLKSSCKGGDSIFHDSFTSALHLRDISLKAFEDLVRIPVRYKYDVGGYFYTDSKPTIELTPVDPKATSSLPFTISSIAHINWAPPFQGTFPTTNSLDDLSTDMRDYLSAAKAFAALVDDPARQFHHRLEPGQCVIFNNRRILHGRTAFDSGKGERWLKGGYVNTEDFRSTLVRCLNASA